MKRIFDYFSAVLLLLFVGSTVSYGATFTELSDEIEPWRGNAGIYEILASGGTWVIGGGGGAFIGGSGTSYGQLKTSTDLSTFTNRSPSLSLGSSWIGALATDSTTWAIGGAEGKLKTTTDFSTFTDRSTDLSFGGNDINSIAYYGGTWLIGGDAGELKSTTDFSTFTDHTTALGWSSSDNIMTVEVDSSGSTWAVGGLNGKLAISTNLSSWTDKSSALGFSSSAVDVIHYDGGTWAIGGADGKLKVTTDFTTFVDRTTALDFSSNTVFAIECDGTTWAIGGGAGKLKTTTDFSTFTDRTSSRAGSFEIRGIEKSGTTWAIVGADGGMEYTTDFSAFTDKTRAASFGGLIRGSAVNSDGSTWAVGGNDGELYISTDLSTFTDKTSSLNFGAGNDIGAIANLGNTWAIGGGSSGAKLVITTDNFSTFTDKTSALGSFNFITDIDVQKGCSSGCTWAIASLGGVLKTTTDFSTFTSTNIGFAVNDIENDGTTWALGGYDTSNNAVLKTTTNLTNALSYVDCSTALGFGSNKVLTISYDGSSTWAIGGENGQIKTTTDFSSFTDRSTAVGFGTSDITTINNDTVTWMIGGNDGKLKTTNDFSTVTDRTSELGFDDDYSSVSKITATKDGTSSSSGKFLFGGVNHRLATNGSNPVAVDLVYFRGKWTGNAILLEWRTASEWDVLGFKVWRSFAPNTKEVELGFVFPKGGVGTGAVYDLVDMNVEEGRTYYYWLEVYNTDGTIDRYAPGAVCACYEENVDTRGTYDDDGWVDITDPDNSTSYGGGGCGLMRTPGRAFGTLWAGSALYLAILLIWLRRNHLYLRRKD